MQSQQAVVKNSNNVLGVVRFALGVILASVPSILLFSQKLIAIDTLHVGLVQMISVLIYSIFQRKSTENERSPFIRQPTVKPPSPRAITGRSTKRKEKKPKKIAAANGASKEALDSSRCKPNEPGAFEFAPSQITSILRSALNVTYPELARKLAFDHVTNPNSSHDFKDVESRLVKGYDPLPDSLSIDDWNCILDNAPGKVYSHPSMRGIFAYKVHFPGVPPWKFWHCLSSLENKNWDDSIDDANILSRLYCRGHHMGSFAWMGLKQILIIKPKDVVVASTSGSFAATETTPFTVMTSARSFDHPNKPPVPAYSRLDIKLQATILQDDKQNGTWFTSLVDMSSAGRFIPASVFKNLACTNLPKSINAFGEYASKVDDALFQEDWVPASLDRPVEYLVSNDSASPSNALMINKTSANMAQADNSSTPSGCNLSNKVSSQDIDNLRDNNDDDDDNDDDDEDDEDDDDAQSDISTDLHTIMDQLRKVSSQLKNKSPTHPIWTILGSAGVTGVIAGTVASYIYRRRLTSLVLSR